MLSENQIRAAAGDQRKNSRQPTRQICNCKPHLKQ